LKIVQTAFTILSVLLVAGVLLVYSSQGNSSTITRTVEFKTTTTLTSAEALTSIANTTATVTVYKALTSVTNTTATVTVYENANVVGDCKGVWYYQSDIGIEYANGTFIPYPETSYTTTYTSSSYANYTLPFVVMSTSTDYGYAPSSAWLVSVCTYKR
jgi:hypothetical protein